jgi:hypothetical protein
MRILAITLAVLFGICCVVAGMLGNWAEGPAPELSGVGALFLISAAVAWKTNRFRYLTATWGLALGFWIVALELFARLFAQSGASAPVTDTTASYDLISIVVISALALLGLISSLAGPARDP